MRQLKQIGKQMAQAPDGQISLTDPDARSMATSGRGTGMVGYNVQTAVDAKHHLIVAHEVTNVGHDREQLSPMAHQTRDAIGKDKLTVLADRGYFKDQQHTGEEARIGQRGKCHPNEYSGTRRSEQEEESAVFQSKRIPQIPNQAEQKGDVQRNGRQQPKD
jgi:hypothetical protein